MRFSNKMKRIVAIVIVAAMAASVLIGVVYMFAA